DIAYSAEAPAPDGSLQHVDLLRSVRTADLPAARLYQWDFRGDREVPGSTALGVSTAVIDDLRTTGQTDISVPAGIQPGTLSGTLFRVEPAAVPYTVIVNDEPIALKAIHARGRAGRNEFWFLDDSANPLALQWTLADLGIKLTVVKISFPL